MGRRLRQLEAGSVYHVTARGTGPMTIFVDDRDRALFLHRLATVISRFRWAMPAICLMNTHYHALVQTPEPSLASGMHQLNGYYAQHFNRRHGRVGALFQGRYHAALIRDESHFAAVVDYIEMNPVRAGLCRTPEDWPWSWRLL